MLARCIMGLKAAQIKHWEWLREAKSMGIERRFNAVVETLCYGDVSSMASALMNPPRAALHRPELLEFSTGSDVSIVVKYEI